MIMNLNRTLAVLLLFMGGALIWLGGQLLLAGGSAYYFPCGLTLIVIAWWLWKQSPFALRLFAALWGVTLVWSLWESGLNGWALAARLGLLTGIGLWLSMPWVRRSLGVPASTIVTKVALALATVALISGTSWIFWNDRITGGTEITNASGVAQELRAGDWLHYGNARGGNRYSPLKQIDAENVGALTRAWTYSLGKEPNGEAAPFEATPLKIGDRLYICSGYNDIIAIDAETGKQAWRFNAHANTDGIFGQTCRGLTYYKLPVAVAGTPCAERLYTATIDSRLIAVDLATGKMCREFGTYGVVNLLKGMSVAPTGYYHVTSPPALVKGKLVIGGWVTDGQKTGEPSGVIRAYDAVTGQFAWAWDMGRPDRQTEPGVDETYTPGTPNSWAPMSADEALGLVYVPMGNATPDYHGGHRSAEMDIYSSAVVALDAATGKPRWHFQTTHHDLWDYDVPSQPVLVDLSDGRPALLQPTKRGEIFMLDRRTGKPIAEVTEKPVPVSTLDGERSSPTQPFSTGLPSFAGTRPSETTMWGLTPIDQAWCRLQFRRARFEGSLTPIGVDKPTITWPGSLGGMNWGSVSVDPRRRIMIVNSSHVINYNQLLTRAQADAIGLKPVAKPSYENVAGPVAQAGAPYAASIRPFLSPLVAPCTQPPYGMISAVDLNTRKLIWQKPFGTARDSGPLLLRSGLPIPMGVPNIGGSVITASGLVFIGATQEHMIHAYDAMTGRELWKGQLPAGGNATPMTYWSAKSGRQFIVIAAGGHGGILSGYSDKLVAFALPERP
jgi:quinoprotein glucose dehydrogenase